MAGRIRGTGSTQARRAPWLDSVGVCARARCCRLAAACAPKTAPPPAVGDAALSRLRLPGCAGTASAQPATRRTAQGRLAVAAGRRPPRGRPQLRRLAQAHAGVLSRRKPVSATARSRERTTRRRSQHFDRPSSRTRGTRRRWSGRGDALLALGPARRRAPELRGGGWRPTRRSRRCAAGSRCCAARPPGRRGRRAEGGRGRTLGEARQLYPAGDCRVAAEPVPVSRAGRRRARRTTTWLPRSCTRRKPRELEPRMPRALVLIGRDPRGPRRRSPARARGLHRGARARAERRAGGARRATCVTRRRWRRMPAEYQSIETAATVTRAQLAALIGVRLDPLLKRADRTHGRASSPTRARTGRRRGSCRSPAAGVMEVYANHTFQPAAPMRRADLARAASRVLALIADETPALAARWRDAPARRFPDVPPGPSELSCSVARRRGRRHGTGRGRHASS